MTRRSPTRPLALLCLALPSALVAGSCATSSGSVYSAAASGEGAAARASAEAAKRKEEERSREERKPPASSGGGLQWTIEPAGAGGAAAPASRPRTGTLELAGLEPGCEVRIDGIPRPLLASLTLAEGEHELLVSRFGYRDVAAEATIVAGRATRIDLAWRPARFYLLGLDCDPEAFDPRDPGFLGGAALTLRASAPGEALVRALSADGATLREIGPVPLRSRATVIRWDGRDAGGRAAPPGVYELRVEARGEDGLEESRSARVRVVSGAYARSSSLYSGVSGAAFAPDARTLGPGRIELASAFLAHLEPGSAGMEGVGTVSAGARFGLGGGAAASADSATGTAGSPGPGGLELDLSCMGVLWAADPFANSFVATGALKAALPRRADSPIAAAAYAKLSLARFLSSPDGWAPSWDGHARYSGVSAGLPVELAAGGARAFLCPELQVSGFYPYWADEGAPWPVPGLFAWGYLRAGVEGSAGPLSVALSAAFRSRPFGEPFGLKLPLPVAAELRWHSPDSPLVLLAFATGELRAPAAFYFGGGLGAGLRY